MRDLPTTAQLQSAVKRINDRINQLEKQGLQNSRSYQNYIDLTIKLGGQGFKYSQRGYASMNLPRLKNLTDEQKKLLEKMGRKNSYNTSGHELEQAKKQYSERYGEKKPTKKELQEIVQRNAEIHAFIEDNNNQIYKVAELTEAVRAPRRLTFNEADKLLDMYNNPNYRDNNGQFVGDKKKSRPIPPEN